MQIKVKRTVVGKPRVSVDVSAKIGGYIFSVRGLWPKTARSLVAKLKRNRKKIEKALVVWLEESEQCASLSVQVDLAKKAWMEARVKVSAANAELHTLSWCYNPVPDQERKGRKA